ncbi:MAG: SDR family NAD(P)-dependent oxidoreductase, partial [Gammaproteobacteria bacterium]|nr:SDR family NAD(P)-dependent oxidoreductase [Gammaproteobacteria bacterium]
MATIVVTGCNRGIGLEVCRQMHERGDDVIGVCRTSSDDLESIGIRVIDGVDVSDDAGVSKLAEAIGDLPIDVLINNAGILRSDSLETVDYGSMLEQY